MSIETINTTPNITPSPDVNMLMYAGEGTATTPYYEVFLRETKASLYAEPEKGVFVIGAPDTSPLEDRVTPDFTTKGPKGAGRAMMRLLSKTPESPAIAFDSQGVTYHLSDEADPARRFAVVAMSNNEAGEPTATRLTVDPETHIGHYEPKAGDHLYIVTEAAAGSLTEDGIDETTVVTLMQGDNSPYGVFIVSDEQAGSMTVARQAAAEKRKTFNVAKKVSQRIDAKKTIPSTPASAVPAASSEAQESAEMVAELKRDIEADRLTDASDAETPTITITDNRNVSRLENQFTPDATPTSVVVAPEEKSASSRALDNLRKMRGGISVAADETTVTLPVAARFDKSDRYTAALKEYDAADTELAKGMAVRTKLGMFARRKTRERLDEQNTATAEAYFAQSDLFERLQVEKWKVNKPDITDEEITAKLAAYHTAKQRLHAMRTQHEFREIKKFGRLSEWHDTLSEKYAGLNKKQKIVVGLGVAGVIGVASLAAGAAFGAVGVAGMAGAKMYKTYTQGRAGLYAPSQRVDTLMTRVEDESGETAPKTDETLRREARESMERRQKARTAEVDKINKRTKLMVLGSGALFGAGFIASHLGEIQDAAHNLFGAHEAAREVSAPADIPKPPVPVDHAMPPVKTPEVSFSADALRVDAGEGWYQTFSEMGVTNATEQANLLQKVGPELVRRGVAYQMADGSYGISRPGALSKDVLELIQKSR